MNPISEETIEQIDSFVFKLSDAQLAEWLNDYKKVQYNLVLYYVGTRFVWKNPKSSDMILRIFNVFIRCYQTYVIELPIIKKTELLNVYKPWTNHNFYLPIEINPYSPVVKLNKDFDQPILFNYINMKIAGNLDNPSLFKFEDRPYVLSNIMTTVDIINHKVVKLFDKQNS